MCLSVHPSICFHLCLSASQLPWDKRRGTVHSGQLTSWMQSYIMFSPKRIIG